MQEEVYVSCDIEATGPIPGPYSMISLGCVALLADGTEVGTFEANIKQLPLATVDPATKVFWDKNPEAWEIATKDPRDPAEVMTEFVEWASALPGKPVFVAYPAGFDWTFVYFYIMMFAKPKSVLGSEDGMAVNPFSFSALDMKSFAMAMLKTPFRATTKRTFPAHWIDVECKHPHVALEDAREQGQIFIKMLKELGFTRDNAVLHERK